MGGTCPSDTEVVSLSEKEASVPWCLSDLAGHDNGVYSAAGGPLQYEGRQMKFKGIKVL